MSQKLVFRVPWTEIFRPKNLEEVILTKRQKTQILNWWRAWIVIWNLVNYWNYHYRERWLDFIKTADGKSFLQKYNRKWRDFFKERFEMWINGNSISVPQSHYLLFEKKSPRSKDVTTNLKPTAINELRKWLEETWTDFLNKNGISESLPAIPPLPPYKPLLLVGPPGTGKTSSVYALADEEGIVVVEFNASDKRGGLVVREVIREALKSAGFIYGEKYTKPPRIILLDEVDGLSGKDDRGGFSALLKILDEVKLPIVFTANVMHDRKIRMLMIYSVTVFFDRPYDYQIQMLVERIAKRMNLKLPPDVISKLKYAPDFRTVVEALETYYYTGILPTLYHEEQYNIQDAIRMAFGMKADTIEKTVLKVSKYLSSIPDIDPSDIILWVWENAYNFLDHTKEITLFYKMLAEADYLFKLGMKTLQWRIAYRDAMNLLYWAIALYGKPVNNIWKLRKIKVNKPTIIEKLGQFKRLMEGTVEEEEEETTETKKTGLRPLLEAYSKHVHVSRKRTIFELKFLLYMAKKEPKDFGALMAYLYVPPETIRLFLKHYITKKEERERLEKIIMESYEENLGKIGPKVLASEERSKLSQIYAEQERKVEKRTEQREQIPSKEKEHEKTKIETSSKAEEVKTEKEKHHKRTGRKKKKESPGITLDQFF